MFSQGQFLIDPNAPPEEIVRKRAALNKVMRAYGRANNIGEGVGDLMMGIGEGVQNWRVGKAERSQTEGANSAFESLFGGGAAAEPTIDASGFPSAPSEPGFPPAPAAPSTVSMPKGENADYIRQGLIQRGLPEHVADAFVVNFQDESGLNPGINEASPTVPGSRGGFGLYQLTGPRRVAYEQFAKERGVGLDDTDAQLDFLMLEGQGSEKSAFDKILSAPDTATAAQTIVSDFLRPAQTHRDSRVARYAGLSSQQQPAPQALDAMAGQQANQATISDPLAFNQQSMRMSPDLAGPPPVPQGQPPIPGIQQSPTMDNMAGRMPAPEGQSMPQGRDALAAALMQQQAAPPAQQAIEQQMQSGNDADVLAQFNSPQLNAADPTQGILKVLMERGGQTAPTNPAMSRVQQAMQGQNGTSLDLNKAIELMNNPFLDKGKKAVLGAMIERQMAAQDPSNQLDMEYKRAQLEKLRAPEAGFRRATPEEAAAFGAPSGQIGPDGRFYPVNPPSGTSLQVDPTTGAVTFQQGSGVKPLTEAQSKDTVYATRAEGALPMLDQFGEALTSPLERAADSDPTGLLRGQQSPEYQQAKQAGDEFLQAILRKDTGAAITEGEMNSYGRTYLPMPGDGPEVLAQKKVARTRALNAMKSGMPPQAILMQEKALEKSQPQPSDAAPSLPDGVTEDDITFTMEKHGLTREQVLERLNAN